MTVGSWLPLIATERRPHVYLAISIPEETRFRGNVQAANCLQMISSATRTKDRITEPSIGLSSQLSLNPTLCKEPIMQQTFTTADGRTYEDRSSDAGSTCGKCAFDARQRATGCQGCRPPEEPCCLLGWYWVETTPPEPDPNPL